MANSETSLLRTWAMVLGFLVALMLLLGGFGYFMKTVSVGHKSPQAAAPQAQTGVQH